MGAGASEMGPEIGPFQSLVANGRREGWAGLLGLIFFFLRPGLTRLGGGAGRGRTSTR